MPVSSTTIRCVGRPMWRRTIVSSAGGAARRLSASPGASRLGRSMTAPFVRMSWRIVRSALRPGLGRLLARHEADLPEGFLGLVDGEQRDRGDAEPLADVADLEPGGGRLDG